MAGTLATHKLYTLNTYLTLLKGLKYNNSIHSVPKMSPSKKQTKPSVLPFELHEEIIVNNYVEGHKKYSQPIINQSIINLADSSVG